MSKKKFWAIVLSLVMVLSLVPQGIFAAAGDVPDHSKVRKDNGDGTYTLSLSVTGDSEKKVHKVNVTFILDASNSMYVNDTDPDTAGIQTRMASTLEAMEGVAEKLLSYNGKDGNPDDTVEIALIAFAEDAGQTVANRIAVQPTTSLETFVGTAGGNTANCAEYYRADHNYHGTNWSAALLLAGGDDRVDYGDDDQTFVIFFTDGQPTRYVDQTTTGYTEVENSYKAALDPAKKIVDSVTDGGLGQTLYSIFAFGDNGENGNNFEEASKYLNQLTNYAYTGSETGTPDDTYFYSASSTKELQDAFNAILSKIELAGIGNVAMEDGTTSNVTIEGGDPVSLLTIDDKSFKYYRAGGDYSNIADYDPENGKYGAEWTGAPEAKLEDGTVKWSLGENVVLENDVTYTVTFDCWPSQTTLDTIADIRNNPGENGAWKDLPAEVKKYIDVNGGLLTNTTTSLTYVDTRNGETGKEEFEELEPVTATAIEQMAVTKKWENDIDKQSAKPVTLNVTRDGKPTYKVSLSNDNDWTDKVYISIGILRTKGDDVEILASGHDFTFTEPDDLTYHWELDVPVVRPMLVNGVLKMLVKVDDAHQPKDGAAKYTIEGSEYYEDDAQAAGLTATNYRRSSLILTKAVEGEAAPADAVFPFTINVENKLAPETEPTDDKTHSTDYWVWISVRDKDGNPINEGVEGATPEDGSNGWYYAPNKSDVTIDVKAGYSIRINNLPSGSTYKITEGELPAGFEFESSELSIEEGEGEDSSFKGAVTTTGTIESTNTLYKVTFTNSYQLGTLKIVKTFSGLPGGEVPEALKFAVSGPDGFSKEIAYSDFTDGEYTIEELVPGDYTVTESGTEYTNYTLAEDTVTSVKATVKKGETAEASFANEYTQDTATLTLEKIVSGLDDGDAVPADAAFAISGGDFKQTVKYSELTDGKYELTVPVGTYTVEETGADVEGYTLETTYSADATVEKGGTGKLTVTNTYTKEKTEIEKIELVLTKEWKDNKDEFKIRPKEVTFVVTGSDGKTYDVPLKGSGDTWTAKLEVPKTTEDGKEITYTVDEKAVPAGYEKSLDGFTVTNKLAEFAPCYGDPPVKKVLDGDSPAPAETFTFVFKADDTDVKELKDKLPMPEAADKGAQEMTVDIKGEGEHEFGIITFEKPGTYSYIIYEKAGTTEGYTYDDTEYKIVYEVTANAETKTLECKKTVNGTEIKGTEKENIAEFTFTNVYKKPADIPDTGDHNDILLWSGIAVVSLLGVIFLATKRRKEEDAR